MLFQTLDDKNECVAIYTDGNLDFESVPQGLTRTWNYVPYVPGDLECASLYCIGCSLDDACPPHLKEKWEQINKKLRSFRRSFEISLIDMNELCFFDLVQDRFLMEYCDIKNQISQHVFDTYEKPKNYDFLLGLSEVIHDIRYKKLNIDINGLKDIFAIPKTRAFLKKVNLLSPNIEYDIAGTRTGRLTTKRNSFPILTLDKDFRSLIKPNNDLFVELDFNAAELRTVLALSGVEQPQQDIHEWIAKEVFLSGESREDVKKKVFAWLYNPLAKNEKLEQVFRRKEITDKYFDGGRVLTPFDRDIEVDERRAFNYIVQSTTSDLFLRCMINVAKLLKGRKSYVAFSIHDSLVIDLSVEDKSMLSEIVEVFSETDLAKFKINMSVGKNYGSMKTKRL
jgi:hypothetical protein